MSSQPRYGEADYWDKRYEKAEGPFDWYFDYNEKITELLSSFKSKDISILNIGCGNSTFSEYLVRDGYNNVTNLDISSIVIDQMEQKYKTSLPTVKWITMDAMNMSFENESFDVVFDKGTLDAILCGNNSFDNARKMISGVFRILKPNGRFIVMTYGDPQSRTLHFNPFKWSVEHILIHRHTRSSLKRNADKVEADNGEADDDNDDDDDDVSHLYLMKKN